MENISENFSEITSERCYFTPQIPKWGIQEVTVNGPQEENPFTDHWIRGCFRGKSETVEAEGFYDGEGRYLVRFMPSFEGEYQFEIRADFLEEVKK